MKKALGLIAVLSIIFSGASFGSISVDFDSNNGVRVGSKDKRAKWSVGYRFKNKNFDVGFRNRNVDVSFGSRDKKKWGVSFKINKK